ncbi:MAG TPA: cation diffusion facilitator family transporter [Acidobacteriaceae bacterium]|jgi:cobalt-zinc-cadmium efflux system protein|nr:cation diffusion facilitator family transporter [Acidobacteriaceae bacterium]
MHQEAQKSADHSHDGHSHGHDHAHDHDHGHSHGLGGHSHVSLPAEGMTLALGAAVVATFALVAVELLAGYAGHSIALVSDAVHNLTDVPTLVLSWLAMRWAAKPPTPQKTYGYHRAGILAAFVNAMLLTLVSLGLIYESVLRLRTPVEVKTGLMLWVSVFALLINGSITLALSSGRRDLNLRSVWIHNLGDALSNVAIVVGALAIRYTGTTWADPVIGIAIGAMVLWSGIGILRESTHILLEGLPRSIALEEVARAMLKIEGVQEVHDIHIWTLGTDLNALSCHICIPDMHMEESEKVLAKIHEVLDHDFQITHTTIQFERAGLPADAGLYMPEPIRRSES